jgi:hypothetical protein
MRGDGVHGDGASADQRILRGGEEGKGAQHAARRRDVAVLVAALVALTAYVVRFVSQPYGAKLSYVPDDAFYYFQLGREHARSGLWSFDRGQTLTSGFHLAHAWFVSFVESALPGDGALDLRIGLCAVFGGLATAVAIGSLFSAAGRLFPAGRLAALLFVGFAGGMFILPLQAMEWPLAVLAFALAVLGLATERRWLFVVAMLAGPACRFDFVVAAGCLFLAALVDARALDARTRRTLLVGLGAAALGALVVVLHTHAISGHLMQTSARTKAFWGTVAGYQPLYGLEPSSYAFGPSLLLTRALDLGPATMLVPLGVLVIGWIVLRRELAAQPLRARIVARWGALVLVVLPLVYGRIGTAALCWYSALFVVPFFVVVGALASALARRWPSAMRGVTVAGALVAALNAYDARRPVWDARDAFHLLQGLESDASVPRLASWNAGRVGYLGGERAIGIDGLVNDDVYAYLVADRLHCYLVHEQLPVIVDSLDWFDRRSRMLGGGNGRFRAAIRRRTIAGSPTLEAYDVDLAALAADPACSVDLRAQRSREARPYPRPVADAR